MLKVRFGGNFDKMYTELLETEPEINILVFERITLFKRNPSDTRLRNHKLTKRMNDKWAFSITEDIRIIYEITGKNTVRFLAIGPHEKVYH